MPPLISLIAALDKNGVIGKNNALPWHLPADLKHFKSLTLGKSILMGRKTFESIGKPLPGRQNIILTHRSDYQANGCFIVHSVEEALQQAQKAEEFIVIGGSHLFEIFLPLAQRLYLTLIDAEIEGDVYFPNWDRKQWKEVSREEHQADEKNPYDYVFLNLNKL